MDIKIRLYATMKDVAKQSHITVTLEEETVTVAVLRETICTQYPRLAPNMSTAVVAVNRAFAEGTDSIVATDEVAIFPPVSGGSGNVTQTEHPDFHYPIYFALTADDLDLNAIHHHLIQPDVGAIGTFAGSVRGQTDREGLPEETIYLEYEAYEEMALTKMGQIAQEIWEKWPLVKGIAIVQRIGKLDVGELTTYVACASGHRDQGIFDAARYGIDRLKEIVPVWKKEIGHDASVWVEGGYHPTAVDNL